MAELIRVVVADELPVIREGIRSILAKVDNITCVGEAANKDEIMGLCQTNKPDVLLLSLDLPDVSLNNLVPKLQQLRSTLKVLTMIYNSELAPKYPFIAAGVSGCILKSEPRDTILSAIHAVYRGGIWFSHPVLQELLNEKPHERRVAMDLQLTNRELEVLKLLARGWSNQQIADALVVTERTVKFHTGNIYAKLDVPSRAQAISWAWQHNLVNHS